MPQVEFDEYGIARADGRPFFLIGARHMPDGGTPAMLREAGFNAFRITAFGSETAEAEPVPDDLEGIGFWSYLFDRADLARSTAYRSQLIEWIEKIRDHPALVCYENFNEPTLHRARFKAEPEDLAVGTQLIRQLDRRHPVWLAHSCSNTAATLQRFNPSADIVGCNPYPVYKEGTRRHVGFREDGRILDCPDQSIHAVGRYTEKMVAVGAGRPVWMLIQAMANESWYSPIHTPQYAGQGIDRSKILYPTFHEMRFMAFDAIVHGATGLAFAMHRTPVGGDVWDDIVKVAGQLRDLHDALAGRPIEQQPSVEYSDLGYSIWDGVKLAVRSTGRELFVIAVNTSFDPARIEISFLFDVGPAATVEHEQRELAIERNRFADRFEPFSVHVYRVMSRA